jgi:hypothetical protein
MGLGEGPPARGGAPGSRLPRGAALHPAVPFQRGADLGREDHRALRLRAATVTLRRVNQDPAARQL